MTNDSLRELVNRSRKGDSEAYEALVRHFYRRVFAAAYARVRNASDAEDIAQETFVKAYQTLAALQSEERFPGWIVRIAIRRADRYMRSETRRRDTEHKGAFEPLPNGNDAGASDAELARALDGAFLRMPESQQVAVALRFYGDATYPEIADALCISTDAAEKRVKRGVEWLTDHLRRVGYAQTDGERVCRRLMVVPLMPSFAEPLMGLIRRQPASSSERGRLEGWIAGFVFSGMLATALVQGAIVADRVDVADVAEKPDEAIAVELGRWGVSGDQTRGTVRLEESRQLVGGSRGGAIPIPLPGGTGWFPLSGALASTRILFSVGGQGEYDSDVVLINADGTGRRQLTENAKANKNAVMSPDGTRIAFESNRGGNFDIYVMDADGGDLRQLTNRQNNERRPVWSPDGERIAYNTTFPVNDAYSASRLSVMNADGTGQALLTDYSTDSDPAWSPDGTRIAFTSNRHDPYGLQSEEPRTDGLPVGPAEVYLMNADGSDVRQLTFVGECAYAASWSPDGRTIVWAAGDGGGNHLDIYAVDSDGRNVRRLTRNRFLDTAPRFSPDGSKLVFTSNRNGPCDLYVMNPDGSDQRRLSVNARATQADHQLSWTKAPKTRVTAGSWGELRGRE